MLQDINPQLVARLSQRLFFVVNKVDLIHTSEGLEHEEIREYVADLVTKQLGSEGFRLSSDQVNNHDLTCIAEHTPSVLGCYSASWQLCLINDLVQTTGFPIAW